MDYPKSLDAFYNRKSVWSKELLLLRKIILKTELEEKLKWGMPCFCLDNKNVVGISGFKSHFGIWFYQGALLKDKDKILINAQEGKTKAMRQWRMKDMDDIDETRILHYVEEAIANQKAGKEIKIERSKKDPMQISHALKQKLISDKNFKQAFEGLSPGRQKEYAEYIADAKREATKLSRIEKIMPMVFEGIGLNDKYR